MGILTAYMSIYYMHAYCLMKPEEHVKFREAEIIGSFELLCMCWEFIGGTIVAILGILQGGVNNVEAMAPWLPLGSQNLKTKGWKCRKNFGTHLYINARGHTATKASPEGGPN